MSVIIDDLRRIEKLQSAPGKQIPPGMFEIQTATLHFAKPANEQPIGEFIQRIYLYEGIHNSSHFCFKNCSQSQETICLVQCLDLIHAVHFTWKI